MPDRNKAANQYYVTHPVTHNSGMYVHLGIESQQGQDFSHLSRPVQGPTQPPAQWVPGLSPGGLEQLGRGVDHPLPSSAEVKERIELYLYSPFGPSWHVLG